MSRPAWGAWIEICMVSSMSLSAGSSRPAWGAWIEIYSHHVHGVGGGVAPRMGRVD